MSKPLGLIVIELRRIFNSKTCPLHLKKELPPKFTVKSHLFNVKAFLSHVNKPFDNRLVISDRGISHSEPTVILPAKEWDIVLVRFNMRCYNWEKRVCYYNINITIRSIQSSRGQVM